MDLRTVFNLILAVALVVYTLRSFLIRKRHIALIERGHPITGKIEDLKYARNNYHKKGGKCYPIVSFTWEDAHYKLKALSAVDNDHHPLDSDIELLFHPDYPRSVAIQEAAPTPRWRFLLLAALYIAIIIISILAIANRLSH